MTKDLKNILVVLGIGVAVWLYSKRASANIDTTEIEKSDVITTLEKAVGTWKYDPRGNVYDEAFTSAEKAWGLPEGMLRRVAWQESRFNPSALSPVGAQGLMQFMPGTAKFFGIDPLDPYASINASAKYLATLYLKFGNWSEAIAAYNWGEGNVARKGLANAPAETREYYTSITNDLGVV